MNYAEWFQTSIVFAVDPGAAYTGWAFCQVTREKEILFRPLPGLSECAGIEFCRSMPRLHDGEVKLAGWPGYLMGIHHLFQNFPSGTPAMEYVALEASLPPVRPSKTWEATARVRGLLETAAYLKEATVVEVHPNSVLSFFQVGWTHGITGAKQPSKDIRLREKLEFWAKPPKGFFDRGKLTVHLVDAMAVAIYTASHYCGGQLDRIRFTH